MSDENHPKDIQKPSLSVSKYTKALLKVWTEGSPIPSVSPNKISVSQTVSLFAFLYEKMRNAVEFREENLIRKAAIERILKRRIVLNENGRDIAEQLIKELLWARYYENNTIGEEKILEIQTTIDKYFFLRNEMAAGRSAKEQSQIGSFIIDVSSCEIEEVLSPSKKEQAFINFVYQLTRNYITHRGDNKLEKDIQVYIAVERIFAHSDDALVRYHLLKLMIEDITKITWKTADKVLPEIYSAYREIEKSLHHALGEKFKRIIRKQMPPYFILRDVFGQNSHDLIPILSDENILKQKVDESCRRRYEETKDRLRRTGIRSFIYIVLTKAVFAFLIEIPYDLYITKSISYIPIIINIIFPPVLMSVIILSVTVPGDENTRKIFSLIKGIVTYDPENRSEKDSAIIVEKHEKPKSLLFNTIFSFIYLLTYLISFGTIIYILTILKFNYMSQAIFIFFVTLVTFFAFKVVNITSEYLVIDKDSPLSPLLDFFFLPIIHVGQWLSGEVLSKFNVLIFVFDFFIEMPLKAIVEVIDEWFHFIRLKKEEMV